MTREGKGRRCGHRRGSVKQREERLREGREETARVCTVASDEPVLPLEARRSAVALSTASGVSRPVCALTQEIDRS